MRHLDRRSRWYACTFGAAVTSNVRIADKLVAFPILGFVSKSVNFELFPVRSTPFADQI